MFEPDAGRTPALAASHTYSLGLVRRLSRELRARERSLGDDVCLIAASGSVGRLEAHAGSDLDCVVVLEGDQDPGLAARDATHPAVATVLDAAHACGLRLPKAGGIFRAPVWRAQLLDGAARGRLDESPAIYGKRMQCLLDTVAIYRPSRLQALRADLLSWFADGQAPGQPLALLLSELMRYLHSYRVWQLRAARDDGQSARALRLTKLGASRLLTIAATALLVAETAHAGDAARARVEPMLAMSPLARIEAVMGQRDPAGFAALLAAYETVHAALSGPRGIAPGCASAARPAEDAAQDAFGARPEDALARISACLTAYFVRRQGDWPGWVSARLLF